MDRKALENYIAEVYGAEPEHLWARYPNYIVFRHTANRKWFAAVLDVSRKNLGLPGEGGLDVLNVKCGPLLIDSFRREPGIYPAYHMNKANWLSAALDGSVEDEKLKTLLDMSYGMTAPKAKRRGSKEAPTP